MVTGIVVNKKEAAIFLNQQVNSKNTKVPKQLSLQPKVRNSKRLVRRIHPAIIIQRAGRAPESLTQHNVLQLQHTIGNQVVSRFLAGIPKINRSVLTKTLQAAPSGRSSARAVQGISISSKTKAPGATWKKYGAFNWDVSFSTTGRNGWIVQEITNTWQLKNAKGTAIKFALVTPHYWEAWKVDGAGRVTPKVSGYNDRWNQPNLNTIGAVKGAWSTRGKLHFTKKDPATQGFKRNNLATNAGPRLLSSTTAPAGIGSVRLSRSAWGVWDSTARKPFHIGTAWP